MIMCAVHSFYRSLVDVHVIGGLLPLQPHSSPEVALSVRVVRNAGKLHILL